MKVKMALLASSIFVLLLLAFYYVHIRFFPVNVVFYSAILDGVLAVFASGLLLIWMRPFAVFTAFEKIQLAVIWLLLSYAFAISVPTVIDRSLSFYILEKIDQRGGGILQQSFQEVFVDEYLVEHRLVDVRLTEQLESGTIVIENGCVRLTDFGKKITSASRFFRMNLLPKKRLLMGEYSDDLTDPFRKSLDKDDYKC